MRYKKNVAIKVNYVALHRTTGLTDLNMHIYDETGAELGSGFSPILMTEIVGGGGAYYAVFTPDAKGQWRIRIQSATNHDDIQKVFEVGDYDVDDVKAQTQSIEDKTDIIDGNVDLIKLETDKIQTIDDNVDAIKTKTDNLPADTAAELTEIDNKLQTIDDQISTGGYILN